MEKVQILNQEKALQKIKRMAYQIYEQNHEETELIIAGITGQGSIIADLLCKFLGEISNINIHAAYLDFDKKSKQQTDIAIKSDVDTFKHKTVIIVDDVLYTGRTISFSMRPFLTIPLKKLQVAVLIDRGHNLYPIKANYVGYSLSTTLTEHVEVLLTEPSTGVSVY
jgi:pyrimidine operon attenuation protein / uracil phosphoribosyltransferase